MPINGLSSILEKRLAKFSEVCDRFWAATIVVLIANFGMPRWVRLKVVNGVFHAVAFAGYSVFLVRKTLKSANQWGRQLKIMRKTKKMAFENES